MAGLSILKHMHDLSDEDLCARWLENPYYQLLCGEEFFRHQLPFDRSSMTRWRQRMGEDKLTALLQESLHAATRMGAAKPSDFTRVIVDITMEPKAINFPTDAKLLHRARERLVRLAAIGYNFRLLLAWLNALWCAILSIILATNDTKISKTTPDQRSSRTTN